MAVAPPSYCFVAFPQCSKDGLAVFGKNSARPRGEVQEVVYFPAADHDPQSKVECTYIEIEQVPKTHAIVLSRPSWLWVAEMGADEHGVCVGNEAVMTREPASESEALLGMDLARLSRYRWIVPAHSKVELNIFGSTELGQFNRLLHFETVGTKRQYQLQCRGTCLYPTISQDPRLGLERGATAKEALDVVVALLEEHGQGGNSSEDGNSCHTVQSAFLIVDGSETWVLETSGKYWAAEKITEGVKRICHQLSLTTKIDAEHPEIRNYVRSQGWWNGDLDFNFSGVFSVGDDHLACCSGRESLEKRGGKIPPESTLIFNVDLLKIGNGPRSHESFQEMDLNDDWKISKQEVKIDLKKEFEKHGAVVNDTQHDALVEDIFDKEDEDSDGFISARELTYKHDEL